MFRLPWYYLLIYIVVGYLLLWWFDKFQIIKPKPLRYFLVIFIYALLFWLAYDFLIAKI